MCTATALSGSASTVTPARTTCSGSPALSPTRPWSPERRQPFQLERHCEHGQQRQQRTASWADPYTRRDRQQRLQHTPPASGRTAVSWRRAQRTENYGSHGRQRQQRLVRPDQHRWRHQQHGTLTTSAVAPTVFTAGGCRSVNRTSRPVVLPTGQRRLQCQRRLQRSVQLSASASAPAAYHHSSVTNTTTAAARSYCASASGSDIFHAMPATGSR